MLIEGVMDPRTGGERVMEMLLPYLRDIYEDPERGRRTSRFAV